MLKISLKWAQFQLDEVNYLIALNNNKIVYLNMGANAFDDFSSFLKVNNFEANEDQSLEAFGINKINDYFNHFNLISLDDLELYGTPFQIKVWKTLFSVSRNKLLTYQELAFLVNQPLANRAVGTALKNNPILIFIPCHLVISKSGMINYKAGPELKVFVQSKEKLTF
ncbi:methylated-DNA--[protein]-cysteine S-methyltransferase [Spiroplasma endosymbiont of Panorpa germanica]|uniref:methylated-DNA--[protein]-cysteine S-methyltransferase n=1 Tax=Spiroplasma endosymbiont of Panorpa germanica TaxID=3066314 RepID=UPI0030CDD2EE